MKGKLNRKTKGAAPKSGALRTLQLERDYPRNSPFSQ